MCDNHFLETICALSQNGMEAEYLETGAARLARLEELIPPGSTTASGSSETLTELGVRRMLQERGDPYFDAGDPSLSPEERDRVIRMAFQADVYLTSAAAVTKTGELLVVDGTGNRTAALAYGPKRVLIIMGKQKIVEDMEAAVRRLRTAAAPRNALRQDRGLRGLQTSPPYVLLFSENRLYPIPRAHPRPACRGGGWILRRCSGRRRSLWRLKRHRRASRCWPHLRLVICSGGRGFPVG